MSWLSDDALERLRTLGAADDAELARYAIRERVGRGGMGTVYLASDTRLDRRVALKVLDARDESGELAARLIREAKVLARLEHPGIVPIHDVGELPDGRLYYAMKYVDGTRLDRYAESAPPLAERLRTFGRICEAVAFAHARGVLHRDLKPQNIMVGAFGEVLVMDWGVAKVLASPADLPTEASTVSRPSGRQAEPGATEHGAVLGTPGYMAPEQARGEIEALDPRTDVYALGAVLRYLLTGQPGAAEAETAVFEPRHRSTGGGSDVQFPKRLAAVVGKAMSHDPEGRYPSAVELAADVQRYLEGQTVSALPESFWTRGARFVSRHRVAFLLILAYVVVRLVTVVILGR